MQDDVPVFMDHSLHPPQETIRNIMRSKQLSLEELTRKAVKIQRFWKKCKTRVVQQYHLLFRQIADKLNRQDKISDISGIAHSPGEINQE
jgi:adenine C2-methylase RlmN of 23S rRNA A2503 and tRNA A37